MRRCFFILIVLFLSCKDVSKTQEDSTQTTEMNIAKTHTLIVKLENNAQKKVVNWKEYQSVSDNLKRFATITANEAKNNALQLAEEVKFLKDSIRPKELLTPSFRTRVNVLENEALRLKDMTFIPSIKAKEVNDQVEKIIAAFSATNSKINAVYNQLEVEKEINQEIE